MEVAKYGCPEAVPFTDVAMKVHTKAFSFVKHYAGSKDPINLETVRTMDGLRAQLEQPCAAAHIGSHPEQEREETLQAYLAMLRALTRKIAQGEMSALTNLKVEWSTMSAPSKYLPLSTLDQEHGMAFSLYAATIGQQAFWLLRQPTNASGGEEGMGQERAAQVSTLLRRSAGAFEAAAEVLDGGLASLPGTRPDELAPSMARALRAAALAQAQAVVARRAWERSGGTALVASLYKGVLGFTAEAQQSVREHLGEYNLLPPRFMRYLQLMEHLNKALAFRCMGGEAKGREEMGLALAYLERAKQHVQKALELARTEPSDHAWWAARCLAVEAEIAAFNDACQRENNMIYYQPIPERVPALPEGKAMVKPIPIDFQLWEKEQYMFL